MVFSHWRDALNDEQTHGIVPKILGSKGENYDIDTVGHHITGASIVAAALIWTATAYGLHSDTI